jgi:hypothetical protein
VNLKKRYVVFSRRYTKEEKNGEEVTRNPNNKREKGLQEKGKAALSFFNLLVLLLLHFVGVPRIPSKTTAKTKKYHLIRPSSQNYEEQRR